MISSIPELVKRGYIPTVDHLVPPDVSLADFRHYLLRKREIFRDCGAGAEVLHSGHRKR